MQTADQETVKRMEENDGPRRVEWGHWALTFCRGNRVIAVLHFPVGPGGPSDGALGSPLREAYCAACRAWVARGELPESAVRSAEQLEGRAS